MARKPRIHFPGACYHVMLRGNAGNIIFFNHADPTRFFLLLQEGIEKYHHRIHAYCLMTNHIHLIIQVGEIPLSRVMQNVSFRYTRYINARKKQVGHLFQGRYKAILIDADKYLAELVRYIHNNPVRSKLAGGPEHYPWSSHNAYLGKEDVSWLTTDWLLSQFARQREHAINAFEQFVDCDKDAPHTKEYSRGKVESRILGNDQFVEKALRKASQKNNKRYTLAQLLQAVCSCYGIHPKDLSSRSRQRTLAEARAVAALLVREAEHIRLTDLSLEIQRDLSGLSQAACRLEKRMRHDKTLSAKIHQLGGMKL